MRITNIHGHADPILRAMENDDYNPGNCDYTATGLIKPPRIRALEAIHKDELEEDLEDGLYRLYGKMMHKLLEQAGDFGNEIKEKRYFMDLEVDGKKYVISAQMDLLALVSGRLTDYKFTSAWGYTKGKKAKPEHIQQLNIQKEILKQNDLEVAELNISALLRDWSKGMARTRAAFPERPIVRQELPIWPSQQTLDFMTERVRMHETAKTELPQCNNEDMWGDQKRCKDYCPVKNFCTQFQEQYQSQI